MTENLCLKELELLESINTKLDGLASNIDKGFRGSIDGWNYQQVGNSFVFERTVTYSGSAESIDLNLPNAFQLNRIEQIWNDATSKDFSIRMFTDPSTAYYSQLQNLTGNTETSEVLQLGQEYRYPGGTRIRFYYDNKTASKICKIIVQVVEL